MRNVEETRPRAADAIARDPSENEAAATKPGASGPFTADALNATIEESRLPCEERRGVVIGLGEASASSHVWRSPFDAQAATVRAPVFG